jgi:hypothetical protein
MAGENMNCPGLNHKFTRKTVCNCLVAAILIMLFSACFVSATSQTVWTKQTVPSSTQAIDNSLALDKNGNPHIVYADGYQSPSTIKYASFDGATWNTQTVGSGSGSHLALDANGNPHISYADGYVYPAGGSDLMYASWTGNAWNLQRVDSRGFSGLWFGSFADSIAVDSSGNTHISYCFKDPESHEVNPPNMLKYAYETIKGTTGPSTWSIQTVDQTGDTGWASSIAVDSTGKPHISYIDLTDGTLKYATLTGASWSIQTVDTGVQLNIYRNPVTSLALDSSGKPHIAYCSSDGSLKYASWTGSTWNIQTVDVGGGESTKAVGAGNSLALDAAGNPYISYINYTAADSYSATAVDLKLATLTGSTWNVQTLTPDGVEIMGEDTSIALDAGGNPHISCTSVYPSGGILMYLSQTIQETSPSPSPSPTSSPSPSANPTSSPTSTPSTTPTPTLTATPTPQSSSTVSPTPQATNFQSTLIMLSDGAAYVDQTAATGVAVNITAPSELDGVVLRVASESFGSAQPSGTGNLNVNDAAFYDVQVTSGASPTEATALISITNPAFTQESVMAYWNGSSWVTVPTTFEAPHTICGSISTVYLSGTPIVVGTALTNQGNSPAPFDTTLLIAVGAAIAAVVVVVVVVAVRFRGKKAKAP